MATFRKRGERWQAIVRRKGFDDAVQSFATKGAAETWAKRLERDRDARTASGRTDVDTLTVKAIIEWYMREQREFAAWGRSKEADLNRLQTYAIAERVAADLSMHDYVRHAEGRRRLGAGAATVGNDLIWLRQVLRAGRASLGVQVDMQALEDAVADLRARRIIAKSKERKRRVSADEEKALLKHFAKRDVHAELPMVDIVLFALATARRQEEITRLRWRDLDKAKGIAWLDDVKHPRHKVGNRRAFRVLPEAWAIIERQPKVADEVFSYNPKSIGSAFTNACHLLGIHDLHFHDLRHEATSRLFERGYSIQEVAMFTLHESWATLRRYTHLKPEDVKDR